MARMQVFRCGDLRPGAVLERGRGVEVSPTVWEAIAIWGNRPGAEFGTNWPVRVFEGSADSTAVLSRGANSLHVRAMRVEREVPFDEVLGPNAAELVGVVERVDATPWLRPKADVVERVDALIAEHQAALAEYGPVHVRPARLVRTWHNARELADGIEDEQETTTRAASAAGTMMGGTTAAMVVQVAAHKVARSAYFGTWDGAWREAGRSVANALNTADYPSGLPEATERQKLETMLRSAETLTKALDIARGTARRASWDAAYDLYSKAASRRASPEALGAAASRAARMEIERRWPHRCYHGPTCQVCAALPKVREALIHDFIVRTTWAVWKVAVNAGTYHAWDVAYRVNRLSRPNPWRPLTDLWAAGACPLGATADAFLVLVPEAQN
jgi:hypothetical protein